MGLKIFLYILLFIILWLLIKVLEIRMAYKPVFNWWKKYGGDKYDVSIFNIFAGYNSWILYYLSKLKTSPVNDLNTTQIRFFVDHILKYTYWIGPDGKGNGVLVPAHVAKSVKIFPGQGLDEFDRWFKINNKNIKDFTSDNTAGLYPANLDIKQWRIKIANWAGCMGPKCGEDDGGFWKNVNQISIPDTDKAPTWSAQWQDITYNPDNFLARSGISPDSPIIIGFINNQFADPNTGTKFDPAAFVKLLGNETENLGGWLGYLLGSESANVSEDDYWNLLYTTYSVKPNPPPKSCGDDAGGWLGAIGSALGAGGGIAAMAAMGSAEAAMGPVGWSLLAGGLLVGGLSIGSHAAAVAKCKKGGA